ncbi:uncharacterized protein LOC114287882 isoform X3 [Camellia sinensis]|uniref:uncharacterized protein LOC114287882 isoform X3 n=1 Tax=Camellia sinensis TaxID=4442 RepID=UPI0010367EAB|nr:uncharacterized protein LOC114287882 isoform X3 [Camellia sinensis]
MFSLRRTDTNRMLVDELEAKTVRVQPTRWERMMITSEIEIGQKYCWRLLEVNNGDRQSKIAAKGVVGGRWWSLAIRNGNRRWLLTVKSGRSVDIVGLQQ